MKESDRLASTVALLNVNGAETEVIGDDLIVKGADAPLGGGTVQTHMDHRLAMSAVVLGLASAKPVNVDDTAFIETSFPGFVELMNALGAGLAA